MTIERMHKVIKILEEAGVDESKYFDSDHDIIFIPYHDKDDNIASQLEDVGCHWDSDAGCWASF